MTKESTLHRWALLDKSGKTRGTCTAPGRWRARLEFKRMRNGRPLAEGWSIVDRGPVEAKPAPRRWKLEDFHVGDTIRLMAGHWAVEYHGVPVGTTAKLVETEQGGHFLTDLKPCADKEYAMRFTPIEYTEAQVEKVEPAPQPKAEARRVDVDLLIAERDGLLVLKAEHEQEIATLKAEVNNARSEQERLNHSLADTRSEMMENYHQFSQARDRAEAAEAKLADIAAIMRVNDMVNAIPEDAEPWHLHGLVQTVLAR